MNTIKHKGYTIRTEQEDNEWFWFADDDGDTIASNYDQPGSPKRDGAATEAAAVKQAQTCLNRAIGKGL